MEGGSGREGGIGRRARGWTEGGVDLICKLYPNPFEVFQHVSTPSAEGEGTKGRRWRREGGQRKGYLGCKGSRKLT